MKMRQVAMMDRKKRRRQKERMEDEEEKRKRYEERKIRKNARKAKIYFDANDEIVDEEIVMREKKKGNGSLYYCVNVDFGSEDVIKGKD
jgi:hypothetical protein